MINNIKNTHLKNAGLGARNDISFVETVDDHGNDLGGASRITSFTNGDQKLLQGVAINAIDDIIPPERHISIIQLDVEGYEKEAITGALKTISRWRPIIILEDLEEAQLLESSWFESNILSLGYTRTKSLHGNVVFQQKTKKTIDV